MERYNISNFNKVNGVFNGREDIIQTVINEAVKSFPNLPETEELTLTIGEYYIEIRDNFGFGWYGLFLPAAYQNNAHGIYEVFANEADRQVNCLWNISFFDNIIASGKATGHIELYKDRIGLSDGINSVFINFSKMRHSYVDFSGQDRYFHFLYDNNIETVVSFSE